VQGKTIGEIAEQRERVEDTIEGHLAHYVALGKLDVNDFISTEKLNAVCKILEGNEAEIRMARAYQKKNNDTVVF